MQNQCAEALKHCCGFCDHTQTVYTLQGNDIPTRPGAGADLEAGPAPAPAQPVDATDRHMEDFFKQVTEIKVC